MAATPRIEWVDLSSDVGERPGTAGLAEDFALLEVITSANVACGGHAGDRRSMRTICEVAVGNGVAIGAQVSYVDREGFGRRRLDMAPATLTEQLRQQWGELAEEAGSAGGRVAYMRPHGALYNTALVDAEVAAAVLDATPPGTPVLCLAGTVLAELATRRGHPVAPEIFADRAVTDAGLLVPRGTPGAVLEDPDHVADRLAEWLRTGHLTSHSGTQVAVAARSICVHSDTPGAVAAARKLRETLVAAGAALRPFAGTSATQRPTRIGTPPAAAAANPSPQIRISQYGERAVLVDLEGITAARLADTARQALGPGLLDSVPAATCVLLRFGTPTDAAEVESLLHPHLRGLGAEAETAADDLIKTASITIDVRYDGADLAEVAETLDTSVEEVIELHTQGTYRVAFFGFSPGFAYLTGLPSILQLPRRTTPRTAVPAGAVAVASAYTAVYPRSSPGGWHLLGHTDAQMFDADRNPPTLIVPGSTVRFRPV
ncbi:MAG: 5-oxoprolinase subunit PxpA [Actinobacteria bacterium]|nr:5-oxoprolinase subunit PxpA [Actinomycetota bacterium]